MGTGHLSNINLGGWLFLNLMGFDCLYPQILGWPKSSFRFSWNILWKNLNELLGQPNNPYAKEICFRVTKPSPLSVVISIWKKNKIIRGNRKWLWAQCRDLIGLGTEPCKGHSRQREQHVQRLRGRNEHGVCGDSKGASVAAAEGARGGSLLHDAEQTGKDLIGTVRILNSKRGRECFWINQIGNANLFLCKICSSLAPVTSNLGNLHSLGVLSRPGLPLCLSSALRDTSPRESWSLHTPRAETLSALCLDCLVRMFYSEQLWEVEPGLLWSKGQGCLQSSIIETAPSRVQSCSRVAYSPL